MDVRLGDVLVMKKPHPCGSREWSVMRTGMDFRLKCLGCGHEVLLPRSKAEKNIREIRREKGFSTARAPGWPQSRSTGAKTPRPGAHRTGKSNIRTTNRPQSRPGLRPVFYAPGATMEAKLCGEA